MELARENIRLQTVAFQQGQVTSLEVVDARLNLAKIETQRAQTAYNYVVALAQLLEAAGETQRLASLAAQADIHLTSGYRTMSTFKKQLAGLLGIVMLIFVAWGLYQAFQPQRLPLQGQMDAQEVNVSSKVAGRVGQVNVKLGDTVSQGQLLFQLTSPEVDAKVAQATAAAQAADAVAQKAQAGARPEEVRAAKANWQRAQTGAAIAKTTYDRVNNMFAEGVIARQKRDEAEAQWRAAEQQAQAARAQYDMANAGARPEDRNAASAQARQVGAVLTEAQVALAETTDRRAGGRPGQQDPDPARRAGAAGLSRDDPGQPGRRLGRAAGARRRDGGVRHGQHAYGQCAGVETAADLQGQLGGRDAGLRHLARGAPGRHRLAHLRDPLASGDQGRGPAPRHVGRVSAAVMRMTEAIKPQPGAAGARVGAAACRLLGFRPC